MNDFITRIGKTIARHGLLRDGEPVLVAVSGGLDSMVLLHTLLELGARHGWKLSVAHFNHQLRGADSDADERFVARVAKRLGLRFHSGRGEVARIARTRKQSVEMTARTLRHEFLAACATEHGIRKIALAHHADDQVELFFLRLLRGSGSQGLGGMEWNGPSPADRNLTLLRPLLAEARATLAAQARTAKTRFREDQTNASPDILRNRIRHQLLPGLARDYQPAIADVVLRSMTLLRDEGEFVSVEAMRWMQGRRRNVSFAALHPALQRRLVQFGLLGAGVAPQFGQVEWLRGNPGRWLAVGPGLRCRLKTTGEIERQTEAPGFRSDESRVNLRSKPGRDRFGSAQVHWSFKNGNTLPARSGRRTEHFDAGRVGGEIILRRWRPGDRFRPLGMKHAAKLQDLFVNQKIPRARRHELIVATTADGEIWWVEGLRPGEEFKVTAGTEKMLAWKWRSRPESDVGHVT